MSNVGGNGTADRTPPDELVAEVQARWPWSEWSNALAVSLNESNWDPEAVADTRAPGRPCGAQFRDSQGRLVSAEYSVSYFQVNLCNYPEESWEELRTVPGNVQAAYELWQERAWQPWYFTAVYLGLL